MYPNVPYSPYPQVTHVHVKQKTANKTFLDVISLKPDEVRGQGSI